MGMMDRLLLYGILKNNTGAEVSASGNPATLSGTLEDKPLKDCKLYGWSKQETTTGAQLFELTDNYLWGYFTRGAIAGYYLNAIVWIPCEPNTTYTISGRTSRRDDNAWKNRVGQTMEVPAIGITPTNIVESSANIPITYKTDSDAKYLVLMAVTDGECEAGNRLEILKKDIAKLMINKGSSPLPWEPYTGGQPSPNPEYPQEIVSAGNNGEVGVEMYGKNLVNIPDSEFTGIKLIPITLRKGAYWFMADIKSNASNKSSIMFRKNEEEKVFYDLEQKDGSLKQITLTEDVDEIILYSGTGYVDSVDKLGVYKNIMISVDKPAVYEPYHTPQSISISTPTGLPAIPVDSDGNYTDANGQQWIADYVDLKRGKYVQWIGNCNLESLSWRLNSNIFHSNEISDSKKCGWTTEIGNLICSHYVCNMTAYNMNFRSDGLDNLIGMYDKSIVIKDTRWNKNVELFKQSLNGVYAYYVLDSPIERDLTASEIQAYQNLVTYAPTTIVGNDAECYMEVSAGGGDALRAKKIALILGE